jgi:hypothetical protein
MLITLVINLNHGEVKVYYTHNTVGISTSVKHPPYELNKSQKEAADVTCSPLALSQLLSRSV